MERETVELTTPSGHKVTVLSYITGREKRELTNAYLGSNLNFSLDTQEVKGIDANALNRAQEAAWRTLIQSIDGHKEGEDLGEGKRFSIVDSILDMREQDYDFIVEQVNAITSDSKKKTT